MFEQARSLAAGAKIIISSEGINENGVSKMPTTPVVLSCAFSIEVSLKLLILQETGSVAKGHHIDSLYNELPDDIRDKLIAHYLSENPGETEKSLNENIVKHRNIFVDWRYAFESSDPLECSPDFLYSFAYSLSTFVEQNYEFEKNGNGWL